MIELVGVIQFQAGGIIKLIDLQGDIFKKMLLKP